jgi:hypothetical protein
MADYIDSNISVFTGDGADPFPLPSMSLNPYAPFTETAADLKRELKT